MLAFIHVHVMYACVKDTSLYMCTCRVKKRICQATLAIYNLTFPS